MLSSNKPPWGLIRGGLICKNDLLGGGLFEGAYSEVGAYSSVRYQQFELLSLSEHTSMSVPSGNDTNALCFSKVKLIALFPVPIRLDKALTIPRRRCRYHPKALPYHLEHPGSIAAAMT